MPTSKKSVPDRQAGEHMFTEVFAAVQKLNATAGKSMVEKGQRAGTMIFHPQISISEDKSKRYACFVEIYLKAPGKTGIEVGMDWNGADVEQFKTGLLTLLPALSALAKEGYLAETFTVARMGPDGQETEVYAPSVLEPGMYSLSEQEGT